MRVKPAHPDARPRDPKTGFRIPLEGIDVPDDSKWWHRRLLHGDVVEDKRPPKEIGEALAEAASAQAKAKLDAGAEAPTAPSPAKKEG